MPEKKRPPDLNQENTARSPRGAWRSILWHLENGHELPPEEQHYLLEVAKRMQEVPDDEGTRAFQVAVAKAVVPGGAKDWQRDFPLAIAEWQRKYPFAWPIHRLARELGTVTAAVDRYIAVTGDFQDENGPKRLRDLYYESGLSAAKNRAAEQLSKVSTAASVYTAPSHTVCKAPFSPAFPHIQIVQSSMVQKP